MLKPLDPAAYQLMHDGSLALADVECNGIRVDVDYLESAMEDMDRRIEHSTEKLRTYEAFEVWRRAYGQKMNLDSRPQMSHVIFDLMGHEHKGETTLKGRAKADEEAFQDVDDPFVRRYIKRAKLQKLRGTYLAGLWREMNGDRIHGNFNLNIARTYRSSMDGPNLQNVPIRDPFIGEIIRRCFIPDDNHILVESDFKALEVCGAACYNHDPVLIAYIKDITKCMHRDTASELFMCEPEQVSKECRYVAKNMFVFPEFYGSWFAQCAPNIWQAMTRMHLDVEGVEAREWMKDHGIKKLGEKFLEAIKKRGGDYPDTSPGSFCHHLKQVEQSFWKRFKVYAKWKKDWYEAYLKEGGFNTLTGFRVEGHLSRNDVINYPVQGSSFHILLWCLIQLNKALRKYKMKSKIVLQIHDSILSSVHRKEVRQYVEMANEIMTEKVRKHWPWIIVPLRIENEACGIGETWFDKDPKKLVI